LKTGVGVNPRNNLNQTPLHIAVEEGQQLMVHFLLKQPGIDINVVDMSGNTVRF
jgi:ankyrin repeat protein